MIALSGLALLAIGWLVFTPTKPFTFRDGIGVTLFVIGVLLFVYSAIVTMWRTMP